MKSPKTTPAIIPPAAAILMEWFPFADGPVARIIGIIPTMKASEVIIIGLSLRFAASSAELTRLSRPSSLNSKFNNQNGIFR